jgi:hydrophobe/amphiphile efflux-1 (HAE1) family protein
VSGPFILRPVATTLLTVAIVVLGLLGYRLLPVAALPDVDFPTIQVVTSYPGASPEVVETSITAPLEHRFGQISGLTSMSSTSSFGTSEITLTFNLSRNIDAAAQDVQAAIDASTGWIPIALLPGPPTYHEVNPADVPVLILALTSDTMPLEQVNDAAATTLVQKLSQVSGVGAVTVEGGQTRAVRLVADVARLAGLGLSLEDVRRAIAATTTDIPKGELDGPRQSFEVGANDQLFTAATYENAVIAYRNGAPVLLRDIGRAVDGVENAELAAWYNGKPAVILDIQRQPGANTIRVAEAVRALLPKLRAALPPALKIDVVTDRTVTIRAAIADVQQTLLITVALVVLVIFLFLRRLWATVIPSVVLPVSLIVTFAGMAAAGFSLDNLSLMALTVAAGFVVDDAIVMIENIARYVEAGEAPLAAALKGARQIGFTIVSLTVSLIAVFIPLLLMGGVVGRLFREFAVTLSLAVAISAALSLTLTPMMCAKFLRAEQPGERPNALFRWSERAFDASCRGYMTSLDWVLRHRRTTMLCFTLTVVATAWLYIAIPKGFLPEQDTGLLVGVTDASQDVSFAAMAARQQAVAAAIAGEKSVRGVDSFVGAGTVNPTLNTGRLYIDIGAPSGRGVAVQTVMQRLRQAIAAIPGIALYLQPVQDVTIETRATRTQYQYVLQDLDPAELLLWTQRLTEALRHDPAFADVANDQQDEGLQLAVTVDRELAARYGLTMDAIDQTLYDAFGQRQITTVFAPLTQYRVVLQVDPAARRDPALLDHIYLTAASAQAQTTSDVAAGVGTGFSAPSSPIPLSAIAHVEHRLGPLAITHQGLFPSATISFNLPPGAALGQAVSALHRDERAIGMPDAVTGTLAGAAAEFAASLTSERALILAAIVTVYIVLGVLYESFIHPLTILSTLPSAGVGALLALMLCGMSLDLISLIGIILLIGIVKKNAIMMVDFALDAERREGLTPLAAIRQACRLRYRPIMMTTMAALLGGLPLALGAGTGSELRRPLGVAIVGGLLLSQFLTLYTTPVIYLGFARLGRAMRGGSWSEPAPGAPSPHRSASRLDPPAGGGGVMAE